MDKFTIIDGGKQKQPAGSKQEEFTPSTYIVEYKRDAEDGPKIKEVSGFIIHYGEYLAFCDDPQPRVLAPDFMVPHQYVTNLVKKADDAS